MTARRAGNGGTHGSRPTGCGGHPGRTESSAPTRQNRNRAKRDVEDAVPYTLCSALGTAGRMGPALRGAAVIQGGQGRPPLQRDGGDGVPYKTCHCEERSDAAIRSPPAQRDGFPRQCVPQGHLLRGAHWRGMTARCAGNGGTHGSRPTGCGNHPGRTGSSAPTRQNRNRAKRDVEDAVPYTLCHCEERSDAAIRSPQPKEMDSHASVHPKGTCFAACTGAE